MLFYKLKISLVGYEDRLNRIILFKTKDDLDKLAFTCLSSFNTMAYHLYQFNDDKKTYMCKIGMEENCFDDVVPSHGVLIGDLDIKDDKFTFLYDFGEDYEFSIEILDQLTINGSVKYPIVIDGTGYGIYEDGKTEFFEYLDGKNKEKLQFYRLDSFIDDFNSFNLHENNAKLPFEFREIENGYLHYDQ